MVRHCDGPGAFPHINADLASRDTQTVGREGEAVGPAEVRVAQIDHRTRELFRELDAVGHVRHRMSYAGALRDDEVGVAGCVESDGADLVPSNGIALGELDVGRHASCGALGGPLMMSAGQEGIAGARYDAQHGNGGHQLDQRKTARPRKPCRRRNGRCWRIPPPSARHTRSRSYAPADHRPPRCARIRPLGRPIVASEARLGDTRYRASWLPSLAIRRPVWV